MLNKLGIAMVLGGLVYYVYKLNKGTGREKMYMELHRNHFI